MAEQKMNSFGFITVGLATVILLFTGFFGWAFTANISGAIIAGGRVEVESNRQIVQHLDGGTVSTVHVKEGDFVEKGALLVSLDTADLEGEIEIMNVQLSEFQARRVRLEAERDDAPNLSLDQVMAAMPAVSFDVSDVAKGQVRLFEVRRASYENALGQLNEQKKQLQSQIRGIQGREASLREQLELLDLELSRKETLLAKGLTQSSAVNELRRANASLVGDLAEISNNMAQLQEKISELNIAIVDIHTARTEEAISLLRDIRARELEILERRKNLERKLAFLDIKSPVAGHVFGLTVFAEGAVVRPADPLLYIVPTDQPKVIVAEISAMDVDKLRIDQPVRLRLSSLDAKSTPELFGTTASVSADAFQNERTGASFYRAEIRLNPGEEYRLPAHIDILPGMPVEAYFMTEDRTMIEYLTKPVQDSLARSLRE